MLAVSQMLGVGITTLVSHAAGRKDRESALLVFIVAVPAVVLFEMPGFELRWLWYLSASHGNPELHPTAAAADISITGRLSAQPLARM